VARNGNPGQGQASDDGASFRRADTARDRRLRGSGSCSALAAAEARFRGLQLHVVYVRDRYRPESAPCASPGDSNGDDLPVPSETALREAVHAALGPHLPPGYAESLASPVAGPVSRDAEPGGDSRDLPEAEPDG
jgi:hypothetical protein